jgi:hypothetical protein
MYVTFTHPHLGEEVEAGLSLAGIRRVLGLSERVELALSHYPIHISLHPPFDRIRHHGKRFSDIPFACPQEAKQQGVRVVVPDRAQKSQAQLLWGQTTQNLLCGLDD